MKSIENKNTLKKGTNISMWIFYTLLIANCIYNVSDKVILVGKTAFFIRSFSLISLTVLSAVLLAISIITIVKNYGKFNTKRESNWLVTCCIISALFLILLPTFILSDYIKDMQTGSQTVTTDLYTINTAKAVKGNRRLVVSDGTEAKYFYINEEIENLIENNTSFSTDEDYIKKRIDEQKNSVVRFLKPHNESICVEYYPNTQIVKNVEVLESVDN